MVHYTLTIVIESFRSRHLQMAHDLQTLRLPTAVHKLRGEPDVIFTPSAVKPDLTSRPSMWSKIRSRCGEITRFFVTSPRVY
ncbi:MAG: hypothetical protein EBU21_14095 [Proteobacteria bacterium]|nr:hypothetical protein [Pseudomonadota bacterium]